MVRSLLKRRGTMRKFSVGANSKVLYFVSGNDTFLISRLAIHSKLLITEVVNPSNRSAKTQDSGVEI